MRDRPLHLLAAAAFASAVPVALLAYVGGEKVYLSGWVHVIGVGVGALVATVAAGALTVAGARQRDGRAVLVGVAFSVMAAMLLLHGLTTPFVFVELNGVVGLTGGLTLPVGGALFALSALPAVSRPSAVRPLLVLLGIAVVVILGLGALAVAEPALVPDVPEPGSPEAVLLLVVGVGFFTLLFLRALRTYRLTHRFADLLVAVGVVWLAAALAPSLVQDFWKLGWWLGHAFELVGIAIVGGVVAADLYRGSGTSRPLVGDLRAVELVLREEAFLGSHVRALLVALAEKDSSTEEHSRRVALRAVEVGEELGLQPERLRGLALAGLVHDMGKLGVPEEVLRKPGPLTDEEFALVQRHPIDGIEILANAGAFPAAALRAVRQHHERLDGSGYPDGLAADDLDVDTRILGVCDVYDALVSPRVYREPWSHERALSLLEDSTQFDPRCVAALERVIARERRAEPGEPELAVAV